VEPAFTARLVSELVQTPVIRECLQWFAREKQWINEQHLQLSRVPAPTFFEQKRAEWMLAQFRELGCIARIDRAGNVIAHPFENREGPYIALCSLPATPRAFSFPMGDYTDRVFPITAPAWQPYSQSRRQCCRAQRARRCSGPWC
jgi:hypothetical protein